MLAPRGQWGGWVNHHLAVMEFANKCSLRASQPALATCSINSFSPCRKAVRCIRPVVRAAIVVHLKLVIEALRQSPLQPTLRLPSLLRAAHLRLAKG